MKLTTIAALLALFLAFALVFHSDDDGQIWNGFLLFCAAVVLYVVPRFVRWWKS